MLRTDRGDDEGTGEWANQRVSERNDSSGDDDVEIVLPQTGTAQVAFRQPGTC